MKKKATEDQFSELHNLVTSEFLSRIKSGDKPCLLDVGS